MTSPLSVEPVSHAASVVVAIQFVPPTIITLPWKVLVPDNARHEVLRVKGGGRRIGLTEKYRNCLAAASLLAAQQWGRRPTLRESVRVAIVLHEPDKRRRDIGNYVKLIADCLTRVAFVDDEQIYRLEVVRGHVDRFTPRADIEIAPLSRGAPSA